MGDFTSNQRPSLSRRAFMVGGSAALGLAAFPALASIPNTPRRLTLLNLHTGESVKSTYWSDGQYVPGALGEIAHVLRDHRNNSVHPIDPHLLDLLTHLRRSLDANAPFHVISGYRSPESNAMLAAASDGVAHNSLHMQGMAIDIRVPGVQLKHLQKAALSLGSGGVGYYAQSDFVHVDVGRVRRW